MLLTSDALMIAEALMEEEDQKRVMICFSILLRATRPKSIQWCLQSSFKPKSWHSQVKNNGSFQLKRVSFLLIFRNVSQELQL